MGLDRLEASVISMIVAEMCHLILFLRLSLSFACQKASVIVTTVVKMFHSPLCLRPSLAVAMDTVAQVSTPLPPSLACPARPRADLDRQVVASLERGGTQGRRAEVG